jgi:hypothetical protein
MKRFSSLSILFVIMSCVSGCIVQSLNPFYTAGTVIESPVKNGKWKMIDKDGKPEMVNRWLFEKDKITAYDESGLPGVLKVVYFKIEDTLFMDATVDKPDQKVCTWWAMNLTPVHTVCRVEIHDDTLTLKPIDYEWIAKALEAKTFNLPYLKKKEWDSFLITASSQELTDFLKKNRHDSKLFSETHAMIFMMRSKKNKATEPNKTRNADENT